MVSAVCLRGLQLQDVFLHQILSLRVPNRRNIELSNQNQGSSLHYDPNPPSSLLYRSSVASNPVQSFCNNEFARCQISPQSKSKYRVVRRNGDILLAIYQIGDRGR